MASRHPPGATPLGQAMRIGVGIDTSRYGHYAAFLRDDLQPADEELKFAESADGYAKFAERIERIRRKWTPMLDVSQDGTNKLQPRAEGLHGQTLDCGGSTPLWIESRYRKGNQSGVKPAHSIVSFSRLTLTLSGRGGQATPRHRAHNSDWTIPTTQGARPRPP
jgi:hypothetical protein